MKLTVKAPAKRDVWVTRATGYGGDADAYHVEEIYSGRDENAAKRAYLEALALSYGDLYELDNNGRHATALAPVFARPGKDDAAPFAWASGGWSHDPIRDDYDPSLAGAEIFYVDENGAELEVEVELSPQEKSPLDALAHNFSIDAMMAMFEKMEFEAGIPDAPRSKPAPAM